MRSVFHTLEVICAVLALAIAGCIYPLFRSGTYIFNYIIDFLGWGEFYSQCYDLATATQIPNFILFTLPDGLWGISYILIIDALWSRYSVWERIIVAGIIPFVGVLSEILQYTHILTGTFDILDVFVYAFPYTLYVLLLLIIKRNQLEKINKTRLFRSNKE